ncbi:hypothetical protein JW977_03465 [Candidatus Falkowbacteria bacterium]|nr:hypothetical protein [Candidatus Falkowbacteria bacterium]
MRYKRDLFCAENMGFCVGINSLKKMGASEKDIEEVIIQVLALRLHLNAVVSKSSVYVRNCEWQRQCNKKWGGYAKELLDMPKSVNLRISSEERRTLAKEYKIFTDFFFRKSKMSVAQIAEKHGQTRGSIYAYFKRYLMLLRHPRNKQEIYQRLLERVMVQN